RRAAPPPAAKASRETIRLPAHPPEMRLPGREPPLTPMPRAPRLAPVADDFSDETFVPRPGGPVPAPAAVAGVAGVVARQFQNVTALHRDFLARQARVQADFLHARQQGIAAVTVMMRASGVVRPASFT